MLLPHAGAPVAALLPPAILTRFPVLARAVFCVWSAHARWVLHLVFAPTLRKVHAVHLTCVLKHRGASVFCFSPSPCCRPSAPRPRARGPHTPTHHTHARTSHARTHHTTPSLARALRSLESSRSKLELSVRPACGQGCRPRLVCSMCAASRRSASNVARAIYIVSCAAAAPVAQFSFGKRPFSCLPAQCIFSQFLLVCFFFGFFFFVS